ncbi:hypothetical protein D3C87_1822170 [compost metagenome]
MQARIIGDLRRDRHVGAIVDDLVDHAGGVVDGKGKGQFGPVDLQPREDRQRQDRAVGGNPQMPAIHTGFSPQEGIGLLFRLEQPRGDLEEALAMGAEADAACLSIK